MPGAPLLIVPVLSRSVWLQAQIVRVLQGKEGPPFSWRREVGGSAGSVCSLQLCYTSLLLLSLSCTLSPEPTGSTAAWLGAATVPSDQLRSCWPLRPVPC